MNRKFFKISGIIAIISFFILGLYLRTSMTSDILTGNTVAFYYSRAAYLEKTGSYLKDDNKTFALYPYKENYPPFPALAAIPLYSLIKPFGITFDAFIAYFPVILYLSIFIIGFLIMKSLYDFEAGLFFSIIFSIVPAAINSTIKTYYTEEALGALLLILSAYYIAKSEKVNGKFFLASIFLTLLALTWQVFVMFYFAIILYAILNIKNRKKFFAVLLVVISSLVFAHIISVWIIGIDYSPFQIMRESLITVREGNQPYFKIAFDRTDLNTRGVDNLFNEFGYVASILIFLGLLEQIFNFKENKNKFLLINGVIALSSIIISLKFRYYAMPFLIMAAALGARSLINVQKMKKSQKIFNVMLAIIILVIIFVSTKLIVPSCSVDLNAPASVQKGKYYELTFTMKNNGFDSACDSKYGQEHAFAGLHIEVENAIILNSTYHPRPSNTSLKYRVPYEDVKWLEATFDCINKDMNGSVKVWVMPTAEKIKINYRCWMPKKYCIAAAPQDMRPEYKAVWRNENCMERYPQKGSICMVPVYAGYYKTKDFSCATRQI